MRIHNIVPPHSARWPVACCRSRRRPPAQVPIFLDLRAETQVRDQHVETTTSCSTRPGDDWSDVDEDGV